MVGLFEMAFEKRQNELNRLLALNIRSLLTTSYVEFFSPRS
jgi:hypothetical protein